MRSPKDESKSIQELITVLFFAVLIILIGYSFEAWLLGLILSWFSVTLTFWQCFAIIFLANSIFSATSSSSK